MTAARDELLTLISERSGLNWYEDEKITDAILGQPALILRLAADVLIDRGITLMADSLRMLAARAVTW